MGWIGNCRASTHLNDGRLIQLTRGHNLAEFGSPHVLTRSLVRGKPEAAHWHRTAIEGYQPRHVV